MNFIFMFFLLTLKEIKGESEEYYECLNPHKTVFSPSNCTSIVIPDPEGYKCCSMNISYENKFAYNCFPIEIKYTQNEEFLEEYMSKRSLANFFTTKGGQIEIECGNEIKFTKVYEKFSDEFNACYIGHINGVADESYCIENNISKYERKCCFIESSEKYYGEMKDDKRCYLIKDEYFNGTKNLTDYLLDEFNKKSLDQIKDTKIKIKCKNYDTFYFQSEENKENKKETSGIKAWLVVIIVIAAVFIILGIIFFIYRRKKKQSISIDNIDNLFNKYD